jgi:Carboxypeptidase regulatory-like domain/TonB-dependent Receptor Plug Domain
MRRTSWVVLLLSFSLSLSVSLFAQKITGTITGVVTDPQGAVVSGAQVTATNQGTGLSRVATTNSSGVYVVPDLPPGSYEVRVKAPSFKEFIAKNVTLDTSSTATINAALSVGAAGDQVTVEATTIQVETTNGAVGNVVSGQEVRELPLNGNNFIQLTQLVPGVSSLSDFNTVKKGLEGNTDFSVNGNNTTGNIFLVDGVNNNDVGSNRTILVYPSTQAIDEFKILRNSYGAEYGQAAGAIVSIVTRGGTNQFHGGASYYGRNTALNAADYFTKRIHSENPLTAPKDPLRRNDYLFNFGGPVVKDKLFFFWSEEWNREVRGATRSAGVPTLAERGGDFSVGSGLPAGCDPPVPATYTNGGKGYAGNIFTGNVIPAGNLSPAGLLYMGMFPLPNLTTPVGCANWAQSFGSPDNWREDNIRGDWHITKTLTMMGRYTRDTWRQPFPSTLQFWGEDVFPQVEDNWAQPSSQATIKLTKLIGSTAVNDFQVSFAANAINVDRQGTGVGGNYFSAPGVVGSTMDANAYVNALVTAMPTYFPLSDKAYPSTPNSNGLAEPGFWGNGPVGITCVSGGCQGALANEGPWHNNEQLLILKDDFSKVFSNHTFKAGFIATNNQKNQRLQNDSLGENTQFWSTAAIQPDTWNSANVPTSNNGIFDMLNLGTKWGVSENSTNLFELMRWHDYEFYGADNWKVRRNLTIDYGVRWSFLRNAYDAAGHFGWWEPNLFNPNLTDGSGNPQVGSPCNGMLTTAVGLAACQAAGLAGGTLGHDTGLVPNNNHLIQPRIGIAWDVRGDGKTAIRAGFGTFYNRFMLNTAMAAPGNPPFVLGLPSLNTINERTLDDAPAFNGVIGTKPSVGIAQNDHIPQAIQYNLTVERELANNTKLELAYVGNQGRFLQLFTNANMPTTFANRVQFAENAGNLALTPFGAATGWGQLNFGSFEGVSHYDALQALFKTRIKVVDAQFAYTWSKSLTNTDISDSSGGQQNPNTILAGDPNSAYGPSILNRPQMLVGSIVYNAPALTGQNAFLRTAVGGWELSSILQYTSGPSITVFANAGNSLTGTGINGPERPNVVANQPCRPSGATPDQWLNASKFTLDGYQIGALPTAGRGVCAGPGLANTDFSIRKNFKVTERVNVKFSMDFFNLFNKTQFLPATVGTNLGNGAGGTGEYCTATTTTTAGDNCFGRPVDTYFWNGTVGSGFGLATGDRGPRQIQYGLRIDF